MSPSDRSPKKGKSREPKPASTSSVPAEKSVAPWELAGMMTDEQRKEFAKALVALYEKAQPRMDAKEAHKPPAT
jgi:hypothetical protein